MFILGIVGSPASGKSTVARRLHALGADWINADLVAHSVLEEPAVQQQLIKHFGTGIADAAGRIERGKLASLVFGDDDTSRQALRYLEGVVHPRTRQRISQRLSDCAAGQIEAVILDVPLLFESGWDQCCDEIWCVDADRDVRQRRAADRGWQRDELARREANQTDINDKRRLSNHVIFNNTTLDQLHHTVDQLWESFRRRHAQHPPTESTHCFSADQ
jgi:dephospho-CoA kinase